jgi:hypothetical protein
MSDPDLPRRRNAEATRVAILDAARAIFSEKGFDAAGTREIADRAGVNAALINRYFGSKEGLFAEAIPPTLVLDLLLAHGPDALGRTAAEIFVGKEKHDGYDPTFAVVRSAASPDAVPAMRAAIEDGMLSPLAAALDGADARERAGLILSLIAGYDLVARIIGVDPVADGDGTTMRRLLRDTIDRLVNPA